MERVVDPDTLTDVARDLERAAAAIPDLRDGLHGSTGSPAVDDALDDFFAAARDQLREATDAVTQLARGAAVAAEAFADADRRMAAR